jgi:putative PIN family toxin of toxin-antitoxin system
MAKSKPLKLIIDTNLWISFVISKKQSLLDSFLFNEEARLLFSTELITEIQETIKSQNLKNTSGQMLWKKCFQYHSSVSFSCSNVC